VSTGPAELRVVGPARSRPFRGVATRTCAEFRGLSQPKRPVQLEVVGAWKDGGVEGLSRGTSRAQAKEGMLGGVCQQFQAHRRGE
jgi:hypothetical protein